MCFCSSCSYVIEFFNQTWPTEAEMAEADRNHKEKKLKKRTLPRGTSEYQVCSGLYIKCFYFVFLYFF